MDFLSAKKGQTTIDLQPVIDLVTQIMPLVIILRVFDSLKF